MATPYTARTRRRLHAQILGTVQGVGFRPHVFRLADELGLAGWVRNDERGVVLEVEGEGDAVERFLERVATEAPPLAVIEAVTAQDVDVLDEGGFEIAESERAGEPQAPVSPDTATCQDCLVELFDPNDRRHRYPFVNCTNCGPRFSIVRGVPYDRRRTTMAGFEMCDRCRAEYEDPRDRRFHAQPNACADCGPRVRLIDPEGRPLPGEDALAKTAAMMLEGAIVAVKGIGGYHLACLAADDSAVANLRARKQRDDKPFALLVADLEGARELVELTPAEEALLSGPERPIVIARRRERVAVAAGVAPRSADLGVMLAYSPVHHLLTADIDAPLVLTSGNVSDEPIAFTDADARTRLASIADALLVNDRPIETRTDDSVVRSVDRGIREAPLLIRRSRGYAPAAVALPFAAPRPILGCGAELKNTFCVAKGTRVWLGPHVGDLKNYETLESYRRGIDHLERLFAVEPAVVAHDLHPDYLATRYAQAREGVEMVGVQHHHAHLAACLAEHGITTAAIGAIFDGAGYGPDGTVWGGEILAGDLTEVERAGLLFPVRLPGGDAATREPWRMACAWLAAAFDTATPELPPRLRESVKEDDWTAVSRLVATGLNSPLTTSAGRLFDAVAAICGIRSRVGHEGQAAAELEGVCARDESGAYPMALLESDGGPVVIDPRETIRALSLELETGVDVAIVAARFHNALADATARACAREAEARGLERVVLSGGVFQNRLLLERCVRGLRSAGLEPIFPTLLPPNDGGIAYGQVAVVAAKERQR